jgi:hypothetical protein
MSGPAQDPKKQQAISELVAVARKMNKEPEVVTEKTWDLLHQTKGSTSEDLIKGVNKANKPRDVVELMGLTVPNLFRSGEAKAKIANHAIALTTAGAKLENGAALLALAKSALELEATNPMSASQATNYYNSQTKNAFNEALKTTKDAIRVADEMGIPRKTQIKIFSNAYSNQRTSNAPFTRDNISSELEVVKHQSGLQLSPRLNDSDFEVRIKKQAI